METSPGSAPQAHESKEQGLESSPISDANTQNDIVQEPVIPPKKSFRFKVTIFMLCLVASVVALDSVIVAACLPAIAISLNGGSVEVFWVGTSYLLAQTVSYISFSRPQVTNRLIKTDCCSSLWHFLGHLVSSI